MSEVWVVIFDEWYVRHEVIGVFATIEAARSFVEAEASKPDYSSSANSVWKWGGNSYYGVGEQCDFTIIRFEVCNA